MGFGTILVNLPLSGAITQAGAEEGPISVLFDAGIANELFPLPLFIGIGAMIDFGPPLKNPWLMLFGATAQFGIFFTFFVAGFFFDINDAASIAIIGAPTAPLPSLWPIHCIPSIWAPLWWLRTLIWRWYPLSSRR